MPTKKKVKAILDFDGTLTDETQQAAELSVIAKQMLAEILGCSLSEIEFRYSQARETILKQPHKSFWEVNGLPATYAYEGAYLLNTSILLKILRSDPKFLRVVEEKFPKRNLDSVTLCANEIFHQGSFHVSPHFLPGAKKLLVDLLESEEIYPVILTNSETRKIAKNLKEIGIGEKGTKHEFKHEIEILGDTRQYHMDPNWEETFSLRKGLRSQILPINSRFRVDLRRPIYHKALRQVISEGWQQIVVAADGFSLAGALPLAMNLNFVLLRTPYTPMWSRRFVGAHPRGRVASDLQDLGNLLHSFVK